jgi:hypothetical protein
MEGRGGTRYTMTTMSVRDQWAPSPSAGRFHSSISKRVKHELTKQDFCEVALGGERRDTGRNGVFGKPEKAPLPRHTSPRRLPLHRKLPRSYADDLADGPR